MEGDIDGLLITEGFDHYERDAVPNDKRVRPQVHATASSTEGETITLVPELRRCFADHGLTRSAQTDILALFRARGYPDLPNSKVIMNQKSVSHLLQSCSNGKMHYFGIAQGVSRTVTAEYLAKCTDISLDFFTDGLSPYKSVKSKVWPILCRLSATCFSYESVPFIVAVFCGKEDPIPGEFLNDFVREAKDLEKNGMKLKGVRYEVRFQKFIADQPARAKMKCVNGQGPSSLVQCERCTIVGKHANRITHFSSTEVRVSQPTLRTDQTFRRRLQPAYHKAVDSPLLELNIDICLFFCYDPMHILYIGVVKRHWEYLVKCKGAQFHITPRRVEEITTFMVRELAPQLPSDFSRRIRGMDSYKLYKGTEWRRFLLYDGILILKKFLPNPCYKNFLLLSCSVRILSSPELIKQGNLVAAARIMLEMFVGDSEKKFGKDFLSIKVHCLTHLVDEVERHGPLDRFSAFPFESYLSRINSAMRAHGRCIEQIVGRVKEGYLLQPVPVVMRSPLTSRAVLSGEITTPSESEEGKREYVKASLPDLVICAERMRDSIFKTYRNEVVRVSRIVHDTALDEVFVMGHQFMHSSNFFSTPLRSKVIGIEKVWSLDPSERQFRILDIKCKCVLLRCSISPREWLCLPYVHGAESLCTPAV